MKAPLFWGQASAVLFFVVGTVGATEPGQTDRSRDEAAALAAKIDQHIARRWTAAQVEPAPCCDDAEFLRRVTLDLAGRIPTVEETRSFLEDKRTDKRARAVDTLLTSPRYPIHFTNVWRALLLPEANNNFQVRLQQGTFEAWLKQQVARNVGYDQMVRDLLTANLGGNGNGLLALASFGQPGPLPFYLAKEFKPENLAAATSRVFLGINVECAQCHNHPFADWKREQFWGFAAFYSGVKSQRLQDFVLPNGEETTKHELTIPGTEKVISARFLDGTAPTWKADESGRTALAAWVTSRDNPWFARNAVNRLWFTFYGTGLVEPLDEMVGANSATSHPELLELLAREFADHQFDVRFLIRALTATQAYQLTSARTSATQDDPRLFARMPLRGLTGEQLFDSLATATGYRDAGGGDDLLSGLLGGNRSARSEFLTRFALTERPTESQTSILRALALMNGKVVGDATSLERSETLAAVVDAPFLTTAERIETLYLAALSRRPDTKERDRAVQFVREAVRNAKGKDAAARRSGQADALADVFWVLLNSPEFLLNH
jgi:hypothetical protein